MNFFDLHADIPLKVDCDENNSAVDLFSNNFNRFIQVGAIWLDDNDKSPLSTYKRRLESFKAYLAKGSLRIAGQGERVTAGVILSVENASFLADNPEMLLKLYCDGVRTLSLSWNGENNLAGGCDSGKCITKKGFEIIKGLNRLGIALDISHLNEKSALQGIEAANTVLATHSCCSSVTNHKRNLSDEVLLALKQKQGIVGICFYPPFLGGNNVFEAIERNIYHLCELGMEDCISIGSDFDGAEMSEMLCQTADVLKLYEYLYSKNITKNLLSKIFYLNALAFFDKMCDNKLSY